MVTQDVHPGEWNDDIQYMQKRKVQGGEYSSPWAYITNELTCWVLVGDCCGIIDAGVLMRDGDDTS